MRAAQLQPDQFRSYPPEARRLATNHIDLLRRLPTIFAATLLREVIDYDWRFPAERGEVDRQLSYLASLPPDQFTRLFAKFAQIRVGAKLEEMEWAKEPIIFSERLTAYLWSTHQIDAFRAAATEYMSRLGSITKDPPPPMPRLTIAVIGKDVQQSPFPLFRKLRPHGVLFNQVQPESGLQTLVETVAARAAAHPLSYGHWYIDGSAPLPASELVSVVAYDLLQPVRTALLHQMQEVVHSGNGGPESMETKLAHLTPEELGMRGEMAKGILNRFQVNLLTQGSGTQIFSTTFVQWAAREALRRAQPVTLLARFTPRQRQRPMNELLEPKPAGVELDPEGSLLDADMGAYYIWIDQQRLSGSAESLFIAWFEGHDKAIAIGPDLPRGTESNQPANMKQLLQWIT